jgi:hypothetical protein
VYGLSLSVENTAIWLKLSVNTSLILLYVLGVWRLIRKV